MYWGVRLGYVPAKSWGKLINWRINLHHFINGRHWVISLAFLVQVFWRRWDACVGNVYGLSSTSSSVLYASSKTNRRRSWKVYSTSGVKMKRFMWTGRSNEVQVLARRFAFGVLVICVVWWLPLLWLWVYGYMLCLLCWKYQNLEMKSNERRVIDFINENIVIVSLSYSSTFKHCLKFNFKFKFMQFFTLSHAGYSNFWIHNQN